MTYETQPRMITLTLPYPISSNRYWRPVNIGKHITIVPTKEAKDYKKLVASYCRVAGIRAPIEGRVAITVQLYPQRPQDWAKRAAKDVAWDDGVRCLDLDNANKVLLDALKGVAIVDDGWPVRSLHSDRMEPDGDARVVVTITQIHVEQVQAELLPAPRLIALPVREMDGVPF
jgi:crossover junction endodeoxyribonuclease RusA